MYMCMHACACLCAGIHVGICLQSPEEGVWSPGTGVTDTAEAPVGECWDWTLGPLSERWVLFTTKFSPAPRSQTLKQCDDFAYSRWIYTIHLQTDMKENNARLNLHLNNETIFLVAIKHTR